ncbi:MAG: substrate-binding domain-containing protein [Pirellulales bacterium]|nr:substrate-binding domain-containing protein [Pirellulales bacterium]
MRCSPFIVLFALCCGCGDHRPVLRVALTTSVRDSGLTEVLIPPFEATHGVRVDVIAAGTGNVLKLGEDGNVDVVLVHARVLEEAFMDAGHGVRREDVMYNNFELLGPPDDPAAVRGLPVPEALRKIRAAGVRFVSRGDNSGTHRRELDLWKSAHEQGDAGHPGLHKWENYLETGQGMGASLIVAEQKQAYVLSDRGTYLNYKQKKISLIALASQSAELRNDYGVMVVNPERHSAINRKLAESFVDYLISPATQQKIADFTVDGESLFVPRHAAN